MGAPFLVGIDLGTTNTVVAFARAEGGAEPEVFPVPQLVGAKETAPRPMLPSTLYAPLEAEGVHDPWGEAPWVGGAYARRRGAEVPGRHVVSAKSWLAYAAVDRHAPVLPWGAGANEGEGDAPGTPRISPVDASARYLEHVRRAWDAAHPGAPLGEQEVVLTVPASFDESARELTLEAAHSVGLAPRLLEEPTAAFYDWMRRGGGAELAALVEGSDAGADGALVLVCDVGGGTTDLSLIRVARGATGASAASVEVSRVAVGRHILLGGDNMDLALAHASEARMSAARLDPARFEQLVSACREAKERLLTDDSVAECKVAVAGSGARLVGATLSTTITRAELEALVVEAFFPKVAAEPEGARARAGLLAFGLPYERDVAITRHVAGFLARHARAGAPRALLLNGGVFRAPRFATRLLESIAPNGGARIRVLSHVEPDLAVARGAVAYSLARHGRGILIGGGSSRGYYVEVAGVDAGARSAVCVVPRGAREGVIQVARARPLSLALGSPARFELYASDEASGDGPGDVVALDDARFTRLPPIAATFTRGAGDRANKHETVRVALEGELTEIGTLDLACVELDPPEGATARRFRLAFTLRETVPPSRASTAPPPSVAPSTRSGGPLGAASDAIVRAFGKASSAATGREAKDLVRELERLLGERSSWDTPTVRALFDALVPGRSGRRRSPDHERVFWQLAGFCLRPGFGDPMDAPRVTLLAPLAPERLSFPDQTRGWQQFFIAWRRVAAGMSDVQQVVLRDFVNPWLAPTEARPRKTRGAKPLADSEMLDMAASLERVPAARRAELAGWILERMWTESDAALWSAVGRLGARVPAYASLDHVVAAATVERWIEQILRLKWSGNAAAVDAIVRLARVTGDRARDVSEAARAELVRCLAPAGASEAQLRSVRELVAVEETERAEFWGESLPVGLRLADGA